MRWLVTGGTGFIGRYLVEELAGRGDSVVVYDVTPPKPGFLPEGFVFCQGDILDRSRLEEVIKTNEVSGIVHLAFLLLSETKTMPYKSVQVNCGGMLNVLEASVKSGVRRVIWASSVQVYGAEEVYGYGRWVDEGVLRRPESLYGSCKVFCEDLAEFYSKEFGLATVGLRFSTVYGHGRASGSNTYLSDAITRAASGLDATLPYADHVYNLLYVKDAARAIVVCMDKPQWPSRIYNICASELVTVQQIADALQAIVPEVKISTTPGKMGVRATPCTSPLRAERELGFVPGYPLVRALADYVSEVRRSRQVDRG